MNIWVASVLLIVTALPGAGCSSLLPPPQREKTLVWLGAQPERYALYYPALLQSEDKLRTLGADSGEKFRRDLGLPDPMVGVVERFAAALPPHAGGVRIVPPAEARSLAVGMDAPVLFFYSQWHLVHRRLPPSFQMNRLQVGMIAKVIPLGQVLSGNGTLSVRTAAWEGSCLPEPFEGGYFHLEEWAADEGTKLREAINEAQKHCGEKLASEFAAALASARGGSP